MNILLIEDNFTIIKGLKYSFEKNNLTLISALSIKDAKKILKDNLDISLIVLDISLPDGNGFDFFKNVIKDLEVPTIFLTAKDEEEDIVMGLNLGAEDYVIKPFRVKELIVRINKILLRCKKDNIISVKDIKFDLDKMIVYKNDIVLELTPLELKLLRLLFISIGKVVRRNIILDKIWQWTGNYVDDHTVTVYFNRIREKIGTNIIITVKGIGYRIDEK